MKESTLSRKVRMIFSEYGFRLFRNQVGQYVVDGRRITSGIGTGSPDLIGWQSMTITPDMVGKKIAVFTGIELKADGSNPTSKQQKWLDAIENAGGNVGIIRGVIGIKNDPLGLIESMLR